MLKLSASFFRLFFFFIFSLGNLTGYSQTNEIRGVVTDNQGVPLSNVSVTLKGTQIGTTTNEQGQFALSVPDKNGNIFIFSSVGFVGREIEQGKNLTLNVRLERQDESLDAVVVVGYGTQRQRDLTGSVGKVDLKDQENLPNINLSQALSGTTAGVNVLGTGGAGAEPSISIRGQNSLSASDRPLIVVDDIIYNGDISDINVSDIESVDILKDASAAAVYGSRSANGVLLITTKKGKTEKPLISFNTYYGRQGITNNPMKIMNAEQYAVKLTDYYWEQNLYQWYQTNPKDDNGKPQRPDVTNKDLVASNLRTVEERNNYLAGNEIDWEKEVRQPGVLQNYNLSLSGKSQKSNYFLSGSMTDEKGILKNDKFKRITVRSNLETNITDWLKIGANFAYSYRNYSGLEADNGWNQTGARTASPLADNKIGSPDYDLYLTGENYMPYPLANLYVDNEDLRNNLFLIGRGVINVPFIKGLKFEFNYSQTYINRTNNSFYPVKTTQGVLNNGLATKNPTQERDWIYNNILTYTRSFGEHKINATFLFSREHRNGDSTGVNVQGFDNPVLGYNNLGFGTIVTAGSSAWEENSLSTMGRINYAYKNKYLMTGTIRRDGFSGFSQDRKFANFPSLSFGWVFTDEPFFQGIKARGADFKLRFSYGANGNQGIGRYSSFTRMAQGAYVYGPSTSIGIYPNILGNSDLGWETSTSFDLGLDFSFLNRRLTGTIDVYSGKTTSVLVTRALPQSSGYVNIWSNIGGLKNKGIEVNLTSVNLDRAFRWETNLVFSLDRDKISKLYGDKNDKDVGNSWFVGEPITAIYDYEMAGGLWTENELYNGTILKNWYPGQFKYVDQNDDGIIDPNNDRVIIGAKAPSYRFSIGNTLRYKNFTLVVFINSIQGGKHFFLEDNSHVVNVDWNSNTVMRVNASAVRPYWTPDNGVNNSTGVFNAPIEHGGIYESRSFVRLQDISLSYSLGESVVRSLGLQNCQVYVSSKNPYTWTRWSGWDPEIGNDDTPMMRNIIMGLRVSF